jgi:3-deoxy-D-manno-octulosonic-acid transferase
LKTKGIYFLYRVVQIIALPLLLLYFVYRGLRDRAYWQSLGQRLGFLPPSYRQTGPGAIWLHAVSVGEVIACLELIRQLRAEFPNAPLFVSTSTQTGQAIATERLRDVAAGVFYVPVDLCFAVRRVLRTLKPSLVVVVETEVWPNLFRETKRTGAALAIVNGRISDRALPRYQPRRWFFSHVLPHADAILTQNETMSERFLSIGAPPECVAAAGNVKYDFQPHEAGPDSPVRRFIERVHPTAVWMAASTMPPAAAGDVDEDDAVVAAFQQLAPRHPFLLLVLVPRKPERFDDAARKLEAAGIPYVRRSALPDTVALPGVLLLDSMGELSGLFPVADVVFMGGTLARRGGHNILEPAFYARPVLVGPHMENFEEIAKEFRAAGACAGVASAGALASAVDALLTDRARAAQIGSRAQDCAEAKRGSTARVVAEMRRLYDAGIPRYRPAWPWFPAGWLLAKLWRYGGMRRMRRASSQQRRLDAPVIGVGNITMGGTGKTPCVLMLARAMQAAGRQPGILTRGYGRRSPVKHQVVDLGVQISAEHTGDEPQIFVRAAVAPVGIGPDRFVTGRMLEQQFGVDLVLLDDGFQHVRLLRQADIVLVDGLNPFAGGELFPLGRLREPLDGLARADLFVITRSEHSALLPAIRRTLRHFNQRAPIFHAGVRPTAWVEHRTGCRIPIAEAPFTRIAGFCGLGNPLSFRRTLEALGLEVTGWVEFEDHHRYRPGELRRMANSLGAGNAQALVTTEKDAINLCEGCDGLVAPLPLYWLAVEMEIDDEAAFLAAIGQRLGLAPGLEKMSTDAQE